MINADEIAALALVLQSHTPMERLSNMEVRSSWSFSGAATGFPTASRKGFVMAVKSIKYSASLTMRATPVMMDLVEVAALAQGRKPGEYVRLAVEDALRSQGYDPAKPINQ